MELHDQPEAPVAAIVRSVLSANGRAVSAAAARRIDARRRWRDKGRKCERVGLGPPRPRCGHRLDAPDVRTSGPGAFGPIAPATAAAQTRESRREVVRRLSAVPMVRPLRRGLLGRGSEPPSLQRAACVVVSSTIAGNEPARVSLSSIARGQLETRPEEPSWPGFFHQNFPSSIRSAAGLFGFFTLIHDFERPER